ncbi:MAG: hypothetical protein U1F87_14895 [Kiritimatiellia bacterium]
MIAGFDTLDRLTSGLNGCVIAVSDLPKAPGRLLQRPEFAGALPGAHIAKVGAKELDAFFCADPANAASSWVLQDTSALENSLEAHAGPHGPAKRGHLDDPGHGPRDLEPHLAGRPGKPQRFVSAAGHRDESEPASAPAIRARVRRPTAGALARYQHYKEAHRKGELFSTFDAWTVWDLRQIVSSNAWNEDRLGSARW